MAQKNFTCEYLAAFGTLQSTTSHHFYILLCARGGRVGSSHTLEKSINVEKRAVFKRSVIVQGRKGGWGSYFSANFGNPFLARRALTKE